MLTLLSNKTDVRNQVPDELNEEDLQKHLFCFDGIDSENDGYN